MPVLKATKYLIGRIERFLIYRVMSLNDTPHRLALGVAIGIFVTWTPTIGLQMILTILLSALFRANKFVGVPFVWLSNPLTIVPIYGPNYFVGCWLLGNSPGKNWHNLMVEASSTSGMWERIAKFAEAILPIFWEVWLGSLVVALFLGVSTYFLMYKLIIVYRTRLNLHHLGKEKAGQGTNETNNQGDRQIKE